MCECVCVKPRLGAAWEQERHTAGVGTDRAALFDEALNVCCSFECLICCHNTCASSASEWWFETANCGWLCSVIAEPSSYGCSRRRFGIHGLRESDWWTAASIWSGSRPFVWTHESWCVKHGNSSFMADGVWPDWKSILNLQRFNLQHIQLTDVCWFYGVRNSILRAFLWGPTTGIRPSPASKLQPLNFGFQKKNLTIGIIFMWAEYNRTSECCLG